MKKIFFVLILFLSAENYFAQTNVYHHFPGTNSGAFWRVDWLDANCNNPTMVYQYFYSGDTLIGSNSYHKVMCTGAWFNLFCGCCTPVGYRGAIREDSLAHKVYIVLPNATADSILYDFNLQVGDTVHSVANVNCPPGITVTSIDSILIGNSYRKQWNFNSMYGMIEGIGSNTGLLEPEWSFEAAGIILCYTDTAVHWDNPNFNDNFGCDTVFQGIKQYEKIPALKIFPNAADETIHIKTDFNFSGGEQLFISDFTGRIVKTFEMNSSEMDLNISGISTGIYFISSSAHFFLPQKFSVIH